MIILLLALMAAICVLAWSNDFVWSHLYIGEITSTHAALLVLTLCVAAAAGVAVLSAFGRLGRRIAAGIITALAISWLVYVFSDRSGGWISAGIAATGIIAALIYRDDISVLRRLALSMFIAVFVYDASFLVRARFAEPEQTVFRMNWLSPAVAPQTPTIVLLLDEWSPEYSGPIEEVLRARQLPVKRVVLPSAGPNTLQAVPGMLIGKDISGALPCGRDLLCTTRGTFAFSRLAVERPVDIVGFFHPYCSMQGLRSCQFMRWSEFQGLGINLYQLGCARILAWASCPSMAARVQRSLGRENIGRALLADRAPRVTLVGKMEDTLHSAPFWKNGGLLYAHLPIPHPPGVERQGSLDADYQFNIASAARIVDQVAQRAQSRFGSDFALVVLTDHPLRAAYWCTTHYYPQSDCGRKLAGHKNGHIPVVLAGRAAKAQPPGAARGLMH